MWRSAASGMIRPTPITGTAIDCFTNDASPTYWSACHGSGPSVKPTPRALGALADTCTAWAPAAWASTACSAASSGVTPPSAYSRPSMRTITANPSPQRARMARITSVMRRARFSTDPPHSSVRVLKRGERKVEMR